MGAGDSVQTKEFASKVCYSGCIVVDEPESDGQECIYPLTLTISSCCSRSNGKVKIRILAANRE